MDSDKIPRLSRLTSILVKLQSRPYVSVKHLSAEFGTSVRTIYRDLSALEEGGVPITTVEGKGYTLVDGFSVPPVMFTESEANAVVLAEKMVAQTKDESLIIEFNKAADKIKAVLRSKQKEKIEFLANRIIIGKNWKGSITSSYLSQIQQALTDLLVVRLHYVKEGDSNALKRNVEPFAIYHNTAENWVLIAWCRLRKDFRTFRLDRMAKLTVLTEKFSAHDLSLAEYVEIQRKRHLTRKSNLKNSP